MKGLRRNRAFGRFFAVIWCFCFTHTHPHSLFFFVLQLSNAQRMHTRCAERTRRSGEASGMKDDDDNEEDMEDQDVVGDEYEEEVIVNNEEDEEEDMGDVAPDQEITFLSASEAAARGAKPIQIKDDDGEEEEKNVNKPRVWRAGIDQLAEDEVLDYEPSGKRSLCFSLPLLGMRCALPSV